MLSPAFQRKTWVNRKRSAAGRSQTNRLTVESLEDRAMMAGNVTAWVARGTLYIRGDDASNGVIVRQVSSTTFTVTGTGGNGLLWDSTRINGGTRTQTFTNVTDDLDINMNNGNDFVEVSGSSRAAPMVLPDDLRVTGGRGNDGLRIEFVRNRDWNDRMTVDMGDGSDWATLRYVTSRDYMNIYMGSGNDTVRVEQQSGFGNTGNSMLVSLGTGDDTMRISGSFWVATITMDGESGNDTIYTDRNPSSWFRYSRFERVISTLTFS